MILITGFAPYKEAMNASGELVESLRRDLPEELGPLESLLAFELVGCDDTSRETEHRSLEDQLDHLLDRYEPSICIFTGQAPPYNKVTIEKIAVNTFMREVIDSERPAAYWSDLPGIENLKSIMEDQNIPAGYSFYGGQHLCNHILFSSLHRADKQQLPHKSGFIHIPLLPDQIIGGRTESPFMPLEMTRKALALIVNHVYEAHNREDHHG